MEKDFLFISLVFIQVTSFISWSAGAQTTDGDQGDKVDTAKALSAQVEKERAKIQALKMKVEKQDKELAKMDRKRKLEIHKNLEKVNPSLAKIYYREFEADLIVASVESAMDAINAINKSSFDEEQEAMARYYENGAGNDHGPRLGERQVSLYEFRRISEEQRSRDKARGQLAKNAPEEFPSGKDDGSGTKGI